MSEYITKEQVQEVFNHTAVCSFDIGVSQVIGQTWAGLLQSINGLPAQPVIPLETVLKDGSGLYFMLYMQSGCLKGVYGKTPESVIEERKQNG